MPKKLVRRKIHTRTFPPPMALGALSYRTPAAVLIQQGLRQWRTHTQSWMIGSVNQHGALDDLLSICRTKWGDSLLTVQSAVDPASDPNRKITDTIVMDVDVRLTSHRTSAQNVGFDHRNGKGRASFTRGSSVSHREPPSDRDCNETCDPECQDAQGGTGSGTDCSRAPNMHSKHPHRFARHTVGIGERPLRRSNAHQIIPRESRPEHGQTLTDAPLSIRPRCSPSARKSAFRGAHRYPPRATVAGGHA